MNKRFRQMKQRKQIERNHFVIALMKRGGATKKHKRSNRKINRDNKDLLE